MTEVKVLCGCGQKFKFDVEPVSGRMPFTVNCPVCGIDGTPAANAILAQKVSMASPPPPQAPPPPPAVPAVARLQINRPVEAAAPAVAAPAAFTPPPLSMPAAGRKSGKEAGEFNLGLGIVGAFVGAAIGVGIMYAFFQWAGFRFPLLGVGTGLLTGFGGKMLARGTDIALGVICSAIAAVAVVASLYLMYGEFPMISIISVIVTASVAYRVSSG
jgi:hypothetical protein